MTRPPELRVLVISVQYTIPTPPPPSLPEYLGHGVSAWSETRPSRI
ncbi:MAG: hypothetical protein ABSE63_10420 [Thermoguttaceae bacterium]